MSTDYQQLVHPELLSESELLEILKNRCIELPNEKYIKKSDLIEMYRRIALPMPQRRYNESKYLGKKLHDLRMSRKISVATEAEQILYESAVSSQNKSSQQMNCRKLKLSNEEVSLTKKMHLSNSNERNGLPDNGLKRKCNDKEVSTQTQGMKRQKITWP